MKKVVVYLLVAVILRCFAAEAREVRSLGLDEALELARAHSPALGVWRAALESAEAKLTTAKTYPFNPSLELEAGDRKGANGSSTDFRVGLFQPIEIRGQGSKRVAAAEASFEATRLLFERELRRLEARVSVAFVNVWEAREVLEINRVDAGLTRELAMVATKRLEAGASTQIEANLARTTSGRAEWRERLAEGSYKEAQTLFAEAVGLQDVVALSPSGEPKPLADEPPPPPLDMLLALAEDNRADLAALGKEIEAAEARLRLARASAVPNLMVGGFYKEEEGTDRIAGARLSWSLPIFNRNQGGVAEAQAALERARAEAALERLALRREVASAHARFEATLAAAEALRDRVLGGLDENLTLLQRSYEAGKMGSPELLLFRRELIESRLDYVRALAEAGRAAVFLELAAGGLTTANVVEE